MVSQPGKDQSHQASSLKGEEKNVTKKIANEMQDLIILTDDYQLQFCLEIKKNCVIILVFLEIIIHTNSCGL